MIVALGREARSASRRLRRSCSRRKSGCRSRRGERSAERVRRRAARARGIAAAAQNRALAITPSINRKANRSISWATLKSLFVVCRAGARKFHVGPSQTVDTPVSWLRDKPESMAAARPRKVASLRHERSRPPWRGPCLPVASGSSYTGGSNAYSAVPHHGSWSSFPAAALAVLGATTAARAQYFGRNSVQWERLKFEVLKTDALRHLLLRRRARARGAGRAHGRALVHPAQPHPRPPVAGAPAGHPLRAATRSSSRRTPSAAPRARARAA